MSSKFHCDCLNILEVTEGGEIPSPPRSEKIQKSPVRIGLNQTRQKTSSPTNTSSFLNNIPVIPIMGGDGTVVKRTLNDPPKRFKQKLYSFRKGCLLRSGLTITC